MRSKKLLSFAALVITLAAVLLGPMAVAAAPNGANGTTMVVYAPLGLRLRTGTSLSEPVLLYLVNGEQVTVLGQPVWNQGIRWSNVQVTRWGVTTTGWAASAYLANYPGYDEPRDSFVGGPGCKVTAAAGLRLRSTPSLAGAISRIVPYGTILVPTGDGPVSADGYVWQKLFINGTSLWGAKEFLECWRAPAP
jgi:uncharacterized protein YgiM (DUF1202 family)